MRGRSSSRSIVRETLFGTSAHTRVLVGGVFRDEDVAAVNEAKPDLCGFMVNWPSSHRHVDRDALRGLISQLDEPISAVGGFIDQPIGYVSELADEMIDAVLLQGVETNNYIASLKHLTRVPIIQAIRVDGEEDVRRANESAADMVMLRAGRVSERLDWSLARRVERPFILADLSSEDTVADAIKALAPWGVELNASLEVSRLKDFERIVRGVATVRGTDHEGHA